MSTIGTVSSGRDRRWTLPSPIATAAEVALEPPPFPLKTPAMPIETFFDDWRCRLTRNLSRRTTGRWEPLTWTHSAAGSGPEVESLPAGIHFARVHSDDAASMS